MTTLDNLLDKAFLKGEETIHGVSMKCVDKTGKAIHVKIAGHDSLAPGAAVLDENVVFKVASATKLITSIALLQCIDQGRVGLNESLSTILPELDHKDIVAVNAQSRLSYQRSRTPITARHLLAHTSGLGYRFLHPVLQKWAQDSGESERSNFVTEFHNTPLLFEPGEGWQYGSSLDWAGVVVRRLHDNISLEEYLVRNIWIPLGRQAPYPTFHISKHVEYLARLMQCVERTTAGQLVDHQLSIGDNPDDEEGGAGLSMTVGDYIAVLQDLISDEPKLLQPATIALMFEPQLPKGSRSVSMLMQLRPAWDMVAGPVRQPEHSVNHGLGGLLLLDEAPEICQPANILAWGGATNVIWFACKERGVAGVFATQLSPFGDAKVRELVQSWKKHIWSIVKATRVSPDRESQQGHRK